MPAVCSLGCSPVAPFYFPFVGFGLLAPVSPQMIWLKGMVVTPFFQLSWSPVLKMGA